MKPFFLFVAFLILSPPALGLGFLAPELRRVSFEFEGGMELNVATDGTHLTELRVFIKGKQISAEKPLLTKVRDPIIGRARIFLYGDDDSEGMLGHVEIPRFDPEVRRNGEPGVVYRLEFSEAGVAGVETTKRPVNWRN